MNFTIFRLVNWKYLHKFIYDEKYRLWIYNYPLIMRYGSITHESFIQEWSYCDSIFHNYFTLKANLSYDCPTNFPSIIKVVSITRATIEIILKYKSQKINLHSIPKLL